MNTKSKKILIEPDFEDLFAFNDKESEMVHKAEMISFRILSEVEKICEERKIKRKELAERVGTSTSYITQLFTGVKQVNTKMMAQFEDALDISFHINAVPDGQSEIDLIAKKITIEKLERYKIRNDECSVMWCQLNKRQPKSEGVLLDQMKEEENYTFQQVG